MVPIGRKDPAAVDIGGQQDRRAAVKRDVHQIAILEIDLGGMPRLR
jgi:hypothetical protein